MTRAAARRDGPQQEEPAELAVLRGWLRGRKTAAVATAAAEGRRASFEYLAERASSAGTRYVVSACTLRQALDRRLPPPTLRTTVAFARATGADEATASRLWAAADRAVNPPRERPAPHVPGRFTTRTGLVNAMNRIRDTAPDTTLRTLARLAGPELSASTLSRLLAGKQFPTAAQLAAFAAACQAGDEATAALLAGHRRVLDGPPPASFYPCAVVELAEERRQRDEAARPWLTEPELDRYDQQRHDEEEAGFRHWAREAEALLDELGDDGEQHTGPGAPATGPAGGAGCDRTVVPRHRRP
ncbi:helix-turn-helix domain-containing protein [Streptomyces anulatus]|uniref:helix-turn-helix domain-containing protein n=1 Tax=Streptomyces anulatus TaxID=1892 RepID=UPI001C2639CF|nr:helix-turn-helix domain-containing protein [Streptomyces anulatus]